MQIGITERGDAGIDLTWSQKLASVDGAILITKCLSPAFEQAILSFSATKPIILHCTCTGWGGSWLEPNVPDYTVQLSMLQSLIQKGFPAERVVVRIDPIIPNEEGLQAACDVIDHVMELKIPVTRFRFSVYDEYAHVKQRLRDMGKEPFYPGKNFYASPAQKQDVIDTLSRYPYRFESCAEDWTQTGNKDHFATRGCISMEDINLMGLTAPDGLSENMQRRSGCHCLSVKRELLTQKRQCPNKCVYCYWKPTA